MSTKPVRVSLIALALALSHIAAYQVGGIFSARTAKSEPARREGAPSSEPRRLTWLTAQPAKANLCSGLRTQLEEARSENKDLTERLDQNNALWRSVLLGPDAANHSDDDDGDDAKQADGEPQTGGWLNGAPPPPAHPMCVARCDLIQKAASIPSTPSS